MAASQKLPEVAWSSDSVLASTVANLGGLGVAANLLPPWFDIDTPDDFRHLVSVADQILGNVARNIKHFLRGYGVRKED
jgi:glycosyltransferase A (GT-A) superfamily protein (DUF2064 family)